MSKKSKQMPVKRTMNLYYKADRTTKPATIAFYMLFVIVVLMGLSKVLIYDMWIKVEDARESLAVVQDRLNGILAELSDYDEVKTKYRLYSATDEERQQIDRMDIVRLLDQNVIAMSQMRSYTVSGTQIQISIDQVTLAEVAEIVRLIEESPIVGSTIVNTAATTGETGTAPVGEVGVLGLAIADETTVTPEPGVGDLVSANIMIQLVKEEKTDEKTTDSP